ncbi:MAG: 3-deoxy-manno-octulosonate cytidylyltransferase [Ignavibacteriae bacterium]|nr:3-deoxy-manno-octulosonate cytidylyltransferase [Ignavibacteriota bacterium]
MPETRNPKPETVLGVIPARYTSVRLPAKPLVDLCGKTMVQRVYEQAKKATLLTRVIVATDNEAIAHVVKSFGGEVMMTSPELRSGSDRVAAVAREIETDIVVNIQGDEPLIEPEMIDQAVRPLIQDSTTQVGTLIRKIETADELLNPNIVKVVLDENQFALYFSRSPIPYLRESTTKDDWHTRHQYYKHIGLYVFRKEFLLEYSSWQESKLEQAEKLEQLRILEHGVRIKAAVTEFDSIPIDTAEDAERVRTIIKQKEKL